MKSEARDAKNIVAPTMPSGSALRPMGIRAFIVRAKSGLSKDSGVSVMNLLRWTGLKVLSAC